MTRFGHWLGGTVLCSLLLLLTACQHTPPRHTVSNIPIQPVSQAKGEWSLRQLSQPNRWDMSQMRYRISLRITQQQFSLAAPCTRLLGRYHTDAVSLRFAEIESRPIVCPAPQESEQLSQLLQHTQSYRIDDDVMFWYDHGSHTLAIWQRIYL